MHAPQIVRFMLTTGTYVYDEIDVLIPVSSICKQRRALLKFPQTLLLTL
jgi:hypothetical protein